VEESVPVVLAYTVLGGGEAGLGIALELEVAVVLGLDLVAGNHPLAKYPI